MIALPLCLCLISAAQPFAPASGEWVSLPIPRLCAGEARHNSLRPEHRAQHLRLSERGLPNIDSEPNVRLPLAALTRQLEEVARAAQGEISIVPSGPELFVSGSPAGLAAARAWLADLEAQTQALEIELRCTLAPVDGQPLIQERAKLLSGDWTSFGKAVVTSYLGDFDVEVAQDSGTADPLMMQAHSGAQVHVSARRLAGSPGVVLVGWLDVAQLSPAASLDPLTNDLGSLELPSLQVVQLSFGESLGANGRLELQYRLSNDGPLWKLSIEAVLAPVAPKSNAGFELLDLSVLASAPLLLEAHLPGVGLNHVLDWKPKTAREVRLDPATVASLLSRERSNSSFLSKSTPSNLSWSDRYLFVPRTDLEGLAKCLALVQAAEASRTHSMRLTLQQAGARAEFPVLLHEEARCVIGREYALLTDYDMEIAAQTWMPDPLVSNLFDGLCVSALATRAGAVQLSAYHSRTPQLRTLDAAVTRTGLVQCPERSIVARSWLQVSPNERIFADQDLLEVGLLSR